MNAVSKMFLAAALSFAMAGNVAAKMYTNPNTGYIYPNDSTGNPQHLIDPKNSSKGYVAFEMDAKGKPVSTQQFPIKEFVTPAKRTKGSAAGYKPTQARIVDAKTKQAAADKAKQDAAAARQVAESAQRTADEKQAEADAAS